MATKKGKLSDLVPDVENANEGNERGQKILEDSLRRYGGGRSILVDKKNRIIAGNKTHAEAGQIGLDKTIVVETKGDELVVVKRLDLDLEKDEKARELAYADNRSAEVGLSWNPKQVMEDVKKGIDLPKVGFTHAEVTKILEQAKDQLENSQDRHGFSDELLEEHQYLVLYFDNSMDWRMAMELFGVDTVEGTDASEGYERTGLGRVIKGAPVLQMLRKDETG